MYKYPSRNIKYHIGTAIGILFVLGFLYMFYLDYSKYNRRLSRLEQLNTNVLGEVLEIDSKTGGHQGFDGGYAYFAGYYIKYIYHYKNETYKDWEFFPSDPEFDNINEFCKKLSIFDKIEIKLDSTNPSNSLINLK